MKIILGIIILLHSYLLMAQDTSSKLKFIVDNVQGQLDENLKSKLQKLLIAKLLVNEGIHLVIAKDSKEKLKEENFYLISVKVEADKNSQYSISGHIDDMKTLKSVTRTSKEKIIDKDLLENFDLMIDILMTEFFNTKGPKVNLPTKKKSLNPGQINKKAYQSYLENEKIKSGREVSLDLRQRIQDIKEEISKRITDITSSVPEEKKKDKEELVSQEEVLSSQESPKVEEQQEAKKHFFFKHKIGLNFQSQDTLVQDVVLASNSFSFLNLSAGGIVTFKAIEPTYFSYSLLIGKNIQGFQNLEIEPRQELQLGIGHPLIYQNLQARLNFVKEKNPFVNVSVRGDDLSAGFISTNFIGPTFSYIFDINRFSHQFDLFYYTSLSSKVDEEYSAIKGKGQKYGLSYSTSGFYKKLILITQYEAFKMNSDDQFNFKHKLISAGIAYEI
jgi:hypothetical protein